MVPVLKGADAKGLLEIAARAPNSPPRRATASSDLADMQGGTFTISSIGGIGGTAFTQIVNAPEVGHLGCGSRVGRTGLERRNLRPAHAAADFRQLRSSRRRRSGRGALSRLHDRTARRLPSRNALKSRPFAGRPDNHDIMCHILSGMLGSSPKQL